MFIYILMAKLTSTEGMWLAARHNLLQNLAPPLECRGPGPAVNGTASGPGEGPASLKGIKRYQDLSHFTHFTFVQRPLNCTWVGSMTPTAHVLLLGNALPPPAGLANKRARLSKLLVQQTGRLDGGKSVQSQKPLKSGEVST